MLDQESGFGVIHYAVSVLGACNDLVGTDSVGIERKEQVVCVLKFLKEVWEMEERHEDHQTSVTMLTSKNRVMEVLKQEEKLKEADGNLAECGHGLKSAGIGNFPKIAKDGEDEEESNSKRLAHCESTFKNIKGKQTSNISTSNGNRSKVGVVTGAMKNSDPISLPMTQTHPSSPTPTPLALRRTARRPTATAKNYYEGPEDDFEDEDYACDGGDGKSQPRRKRRQSKYDDMEDSDDEDVYVAVKKKIPRASGGTQTRIIEEYDIVEVDDDDDDDDVFDDEDLEEDLEELDVDYVKSRKRKRGKGTKAKGGQTKTANGARATSTKKGVKNSNGKLNNNSRGRVAFKPVTTQVVKEALGANSRRGGGDGAKSKTTSNSAMPLATLASNTFLPTTIPTNRVTITVPSISNFSANQQTGPFPYPLPHPLSFQQTHPRSPKALNSLPPLSLAILCKNLTGIQACIEVLNASPFHPGCMFVAKPIGFPTKEATRSMFLEYLKREKRKSNQQGSKNSQATSTTTTKFSKPASQSATQSHRSQRYQTPNHFNASIPLSFSALPSLPKISTNYWVPGDLRTSPLDIAVECGGPESVKQLMAVYWLHVRNWEASTLQRRTMKQQQEHHPTVNQDGFGHILMFGGRHTFGPQTPINTNSTKIRNSGAPPGFDSLFALGYPVGSHESGGSLLGTVRLGAVGDMLQDTVLHRVLGSKLKDSVALVSSSV
jgi:hypothetical protein